MGGVSGWPAVGAGAPELFIILLVSSRVIGGAMTLVQERKSASVLAASLRVAKYIVTLVVLGTAYFVLARAGLLLATIHPSATPIWPATGLAIGCMLVFGLRVWPAILLGAFAANATNEIADLTSANLLLTSSTDRARQHARGADQRQPPQSVGQRAPCVRDAGRRREVCAGCARARNDAQRDDRSRQPRARPAPRTGRVRRPSGSRGGSATSPALWS